MGFFIHTTHMFCLSLISPGNKEWYMLMNNYHLPQLAVSTLSQETNFWNVSRVLKKSIRKIWFIIIMIIIIFLTKIAMKHTMQVTQYPTNTPRVFHVEKTWKRSFPRRFNVEEYTWCVCRVDSNYRTIQNQPPELFCKKKCS